MKSKDYNQLFIRLLKNRYSLDLSDIGSPVLDYTTEDQVLEELERLEEKYELDRCDKWAFNFLASRT